MGLRVLASFTTRHGTFYYSIPKLTDMALYTSYEEWEANLLRSMPDVQNLYIHFIIQPDALERILAAAARHGSKIHTVHIDIGHNKWNPPIRDGAVTSLVAFMRAFPVRSVALQSCGLKAHHWAWLASHAGIASRSMRSFCVKNNPISDATAAASFVRHLRNLEFVEFTNCGLRYNSIRVLVRALFRLRHLVSVDFGDNPNIPRSDATVMSLFKPGGPPHLREVITPSNANVDPDGQVIQLEWKECDGWGFIMHQ